MRRCLYLLLALAAVTLASGASPSRATATSDPPVVEFSTEATVWSTTVPALFDDTFLVPGSGTISQLSIRHHGASPARLTITLSDDPTDPAGQVLRRWASVSIDDQPVRAGQTWSGPIIDPGGTTRVDVEVSLSPTAPPTTRARTAQVLADITLTATSHPRGELPDTGTALGTLTALAALAIILGTALRAHASRPK
ncbi:hypothetical protein PU560_07185 [Georgenia sp. 10Sc9-8]|uniref:LPXTG cell wall anchor domain-containing protein n=1 Tax=Georgenia halotolerans TaxID=3028317 RepID=A0ABT5TW13_9MICO|nr:hypothetical protein [Georgenia halotolerans]